MPLAEFHLNQNNLLQKMVSLNVIVPDSGDGPFPVLYLLHGLSDDHTAWARRTSLERYVSGLPLIVVMPNGERNFYTNAVDKPLAAYETHLTQDIIGFVDRTFRTIPTREGRVTAGLSMGGYGALKLALKHPDLFCAAVSHSGAVDVGRRDFTDDTDWAREWRPIFGANPAGGPDDVFALAAKLGTAKPLSLRIDCGVDDFLIESNREFDAHLTKLGVAHEYAEHPGAHDWNYWNRHILDTLKFFGGVLGYEFKPEQHS